MIAVFIYTLYKIPGIINLASILAGRATPKWLLRKVTGTFGRATVKG